MKTYFVDAFTNQKFKGNPAAVCIGEKDIDNKTMQNIATEIGFSETAFLPPASLLGTECRPYQSHVATT